MFLVLNVVYFFTLLFLLLALYLFFLFTNTHLKFFKKLRQNRVKHIRNGIVVASKQESEINFVSSSTSFASPQSMSSLLFFRETASLTIQKKVPVKTFTADAFFLILSQLIEFELNGDNLLKETSLTPTFVTSNATAYCADLHSSLYENNSVFTIFSGNFGKEIFFATQRGASEGFFQIAISASLSEIPFLMLSNDEIFPAEEMFSISDLLKNNIMVFQPFELVRIIIIFTIILFSLIKTFYVVSKIL